MRLIRQLCMGGGLLLLTSCGPSPIEPGLQDPVIPDVREYVDGEALRALDEDGRFVLPPPAVEGPYQIISWEEAARIAEGVVRTWFANPNSVTLPGFGSLKRLIEEQHGAPIPWEEIQLGPQNPYFAESHLRPLPESFGEPAIRHFGPQYLAPFYVGGQPVLVLAIAAYATNLYLDSDGFVRRADGLERGSEFFANGIPHDAGGIATPPSPEQAVEFVFRETGAKTVRIPVLQTPGYRRAPTGSYWKLQLGESVRVQRVVDGREVVTKDIYVGAMGSAADSRMGLQAALWPELRLLVAAEEQPSSERFGDDALDIREGFAVDLHEVRVGN